MPRIRSIKPEFCTSEQVVECSTNARLLFVLMWCFCDDAGRHPAKAKRLKMEVFPGDSFSEKEVNGFVEELVKAGLLIRYRVGDQEFLQVTGWKHQRIDKPSYKFPPLNKDGTPAKIDDHSATIIRAFDDSSPPDGSGEDRSGEDRSGEDDSGFGDSSPNPQSVFKYSSYSFLVAGGDEWFLPEVKLAEYAKSFPGVDLDRELLKAGQWTRDNTQARKTPKGMFRFLSRWLGRVQDSFSKPATKTKTMTDDELFAEVRKLQ